MRVCRGAFLLVRWNACPTAHNCDLLPSWRPLPCQRRLHFRDMWRALSIKAAVRYKCRRRKGRGGGVYSLFHSLKCSCNSGHFEYAPRNVAPYFREGTSSTKTLCVMEEEISGIFWCEMYPPVTASWGIAEGGGVGGSMKYDLLSCSATSVQWLLCDLLVAGCSGVIPQLRLSASSLIGSTPNTYVLLAYAQKTMDQSIYTQIHMATDGSINLHTDSQIELKQHGLCLKGLRTQPLSGQRGTPLPLSGPFPLAPPLPWGS